MANEERPFYYEMMAKPIEEIREDIFFRYDNFRDEPWYEDFQMYLAIGVCVPKEEHALQVRKALKIMGYDTHTSQRDGQTYVLPGEVRQTIQEPKAKNRHDRER